MIFVDTGARFAVLVPDDLDHGSAADFMRRNMEPLVTTDYVLDELLTLLRARGHQQRAHIFMDDFVAKKNVEIEWVRSNDVDEGWQIYRRYSDKAWSFTDCVSFAIMRRLALTKAFAFDEHFRQFGELVVLP
jgi:predicted nucleic acid-binding protein